MRLLASKPCAAIHFGKARALARARWPFHLELVAGERRRIEIAGEGPGMHPFAAGLLDGWQRTEIAGGHRARLFGEFADRRGEALLAGIRFALGDRPGAFIFLLPERAAGMDEEDL